MEHVPTDNTVELVPTNNTVKLVSIENIISIAELQQTGLETALTNNFQDKKAIQQN